MSVMATFAQCLDISHRAGIQVLPIPLVMPAKIRSVPAMSAFVTVPFERFLAQCFPVGRSQIFPVSTFAFACHIALAPVQPIGLMLVAVPSRLALRFVVVMDSST